MIHPGALVKIKPGAEVSAWRTDPNPRGEYYNIDIDHDAIFLYLEDAGRVLDRYPAAANEEYWRDGKIVPFYDPRLIYFHKVLWGDKVLVVQCSELVIISKPRRIKKETK